MMQPPPDCPNSTAAGAQGSSVTRITTAKLALALIAISLFGWGIKTESNGLRLAGIAFLVAALALRFIRPRAGR